MTRPSFNAVNSVLLGDCVSLMRGLDAESVDFILTDPPYLVNYRDRSGRSIAGDGNGRGCSQLSPKCTASCSRVETARAAGAAA
jgi:site-specific DNA-methyltransferase (adenine-specific)